VDYYNGALGQLNSGDLDGAIESFENAHTIFKGRPEAMLQLGAAYSQKGDFETSAAYFQQVLDLVEGTDYALADSMRVAGWDEYEIQAARFLGQVLTQSENYDEAAAAYTSFLETHPGDVTIMAQLAMVTMAAGDTASAERMYSDLLNMPNITARELYDVGVGLFQSEAYLASAQAFEKVVAIAPNHRDALFNLVTALYQAEQWDRVIELGESLRELDPHNPLAFQYSAFAYAQAGDSDTGVALQETGQNLPFTIDNTRLQPFSSGGASLSGQVTNNTLAEGTPVSLRINFVGLQGETVGSVEVTVVAGAAGMAEVFQAELDSETEVIGFFYEVL
jgi:tetratricopeptide (TPR) repeat protein